MNFYVYELIDPRDGKVFYVGKGKGARVDAHEIEAAKGRVSRKYDLIREIKTLGFHVVKRKVAFFEDEKSAYAFEALHMASFERGELTNIAPGGFGGRYSFPKVKLPDDENFVRDCCHLLSRVMREGGMKWQVLGELKDFRSLIEDSLSKARKIAASRGAEWVNKISEPYGIEFIAGEIERLKLFRRDVSWREVEI